MPAETGAPNRLISLFKSLLSGRGADTADTLDRISRILTPQHGTAGLRQFSRLLRDAGALSAESSLAAGCVMHMAGMPAHRIVQFLSLSLPGGISVSQFELALRFMFATQPSLPENLLYDLTQYPYLERRLLVQRSVELSARLSRAITPEMLLYLYLLSLREDLSNENVHLILLILRICFPALKIPRTARGVSQAEESEIAEAWKNAERSARYAEALGTLAPGAGREDKGVRESASFFLDKYFSDKAQGMSPRQKATGADTPGLLSSRARESAVTDKGRVATTEPAAMASARPKGPEKKKRPARPPSTVSAHRTRTVPQNSGSGPSAISQAEPLSRRGSRAGISLDRLRLAAPFGLAAVFLLAVIAADHRITDLISQPRPLVSSGQRPGSQQPASGPAGINQPGTEQAANPQAEIPRAGDHPPSPSAAHLVQKGDNLWKIYRTLHEEGALDADWRDFLTSVTSRNGIRDPDFIFPGNVLSIATGKK